MLRAATRAPLRFSPPSNGCPNGLRGRVRRSFQSSRPKKAGAPAEGDGISHNVEYVGLWGAIKTFPKRKPFYTNLIVATVKTAMADVVVQKTVERKENLDVKRTGVFTLFGFAYLGIAQWFIYVTVFTRLCPNAVRFSNASWADKLKDKAGMRDCVKQTCLDNFAHYTFIYFPVFYTFKELIQGNDVTDIAGMVPRALAKYKDNFIADNMAIWGLWLPMDMIIYAVPIWMRLPLNHAVSLAWTMILSSMRGAEK